MTLSLFQTTSAQAVQERELHGSALNLGVGIGARQVSIFHANYEFDAASNITLAPFISFYDFTNYIPIGVKGSFYFDEVLNLDREWDLYAGASIAMGIVSDGWNEQYYRDLYRFRGPNAMLFDAHIGMEYQVTPRVGMFLDLSGNAQTIGLVLR